jgi:uncharacterized membrane protein YqiK
MQRFYDEDEGEIPEETKSQKIKYQKEKIKTVSSVPLKIVLALLVIIFVLIIWFAVVLVLTRYKQIQEVEDGKIFRPKHDKRLYKRFVLPNMIESLLVSDPRAK